MTDEIDELKKELEFLKKQNTELRHMAEKFGSDVAIWKHKAIRYEETIRKYENS